MTHLIARERRFVKARAGRGRTILNLTPQPADANFLFSQFAVEIVEAYEF